VARRQGRIAWHVHERLRLRVVDRRTIAADEPAQEVRADLGGSVGREHVSEERRSPPEHCGQQPEEQPEKADAPEVRKGDEDGIEPVGPVVDDPAFEPPVEVD
jgi:hypothetical protein